MLGQALSREQKPFLFWLSTDVYTGTLLHRAASLFPAPFSLLQLKGLYSQLSQAQGRAHATAWQI